MDPYFRIVGLCAPAPSSGKSTCANILRETWGYQTASFAEPAKSMMLRLVTAFYPGSPGAGHHLAAVDWATQFFQDKAKPIEEMPGAPTMRHLLETLGTSWAREHLAPDFWLKPAQMAVTRAADTGYPGIVFDDVRFPNEAAMIRDLGGVLVRVTRPGQVPLAGALAEGLIDDLPADAELVNDATMDVLRMRLGAALTRAFSRSRG